MQKEIVNIEQPKLQQIINIEQSKPQIIQKEIVNIEQPNPQQIINIEQSTLQVIQKEIINIEPPTLQVIQKEIVNVRDTNTERNNSINISEIKNKQDIQPIKTRENKRILFEPLVVMRQINEQTTSEKIIDTRTNKPIESFTTPHSTKDSQPLILDDNASVASFKSKKMSRIMSLKDIKRNAMNSDTLRTNSLQSPR
jgi:hypothetical protein